VQDDDDKLLSFYNAELIALSQQADAVSRLRQPDATAHAVSPICGSTVDIDLRISDGRVTGFGAAADSCALTKTVIAVMSRAIIGHTRADIAAAGQGLEDMLEGRAEEPAGDWADLRILLPVRDYRARHNAILLPFEAVEKAFKNMENA
jgi:NifU-like protein involved in Fe-S cluster formation